MLPKHHIITGIIAAAILYPIFGLNAWIVLATAVFVDFDHVLIYLYRLKKFDLKGAYNYFKKVKDGSGFYPLFHMFETFSVILFAAIYFDILFLKLAAIGVIVHIMHDLAEELFLRPTKRNFFAAGQIIKYFQRSIC